MTAGNDYYLEIADRNHKRIGEAANYVKHVEMGLNERTIEMIKEAFEAGWNKSESTYWANTRLVNGESVPNLLELILERQKNARYRRSKKYKKEMEEKFRYRLQA